MENIQGELKEMNVYCPTCQQKTTQKLISTKRTKGGLVILRKCFRCGKGIELTLSWKRHPLKEPTIECAMRMPVDWRIRAVDLSVNG